MTSSPPMGRPGRAPLRIPILLLSLFGCPLVSGSLLSPEMSPGAAESGRVQLERLRSESRLPQYGACWKRALAALESGCSQLTDEEQTFLALTFANCFLERAGQQTFPCERGTPVKDCLVGISNNAFNTFSNFFTHTQNMCYFLRSQDWQHQTEDTIERLSSSSAAVADAMAEASLVQAEVLKQQRQSLDVQQQIVANGSMLTKAIELSKNNVREMLAEFKTSTDEQRTLIFEIFDRVSKLQNLVVSEVSWLYTVVFYGACLLVVYLGTATKRTADARLWLYCILTVNFLLERAICKLSLPSTDDSVTLVEDLPERIYHRIWILRQTSMLACLSVTGYIAYKFVDYNKVNNRLLEDIRKQNADLKMKMEAVQVNQKQHVGGVSNEGGLQHHLTTFNADEFDHGGEGDVSDIEDDDDDAMSFNSTMSDRTWLDRPGEDNLDVEEEWEEDAEDDLMSEGQFFSAVSSRNGSPADVSGATPPKRASRSSHSRSTTPTVVKPYNLRSRASLMSKQNPILEVETDQDFYKAVSKMQSVSKRNTAKIRMACRNNQTTDLMFSSDEA